MWRLLAARRNEKDWTSRPDCSLEIKTADAQVDAVLRQRLETDVGVQTVYAKV